MYMYAAGFIGLLVLLELPAPASMVLPTHPPGEAALIEIHGCEYPHVHSFIIFTYLKACGLGRNSCVVCGVYIGGGGRVERRESFGVGEKGTGWRLIRSARYWEV